MFFELFSYVEGLVSPIKVDAPIKIETVAELAKDLEDGTVVQVDADVNGELVVGENEFQADKDFGNPIEGDGAWESFSSIGEQFMQGGAFNRNVPNIATYSIGATVVEKNQNQNNILKMAKGGGVDGGGLEYFVISKPTDLKEFWAKKENADKTIFFVEEMDDDDGDGNGQYYVVGMQTKDYYDDNQYWDYDGNYDTIKKATNAANKKAKKTSGGIYAINTSVINGYARGGKVHKTQQSGESNEAYDELTKSKGVGYRFTDKKAKKLGKKENAKPTQEEIKKFKGGKGVYFENRKNRSDVSRMKKLEHGGKINHSMPHQNLINIGATANANPIHNVENKPIKDTIGFGEFIVIEH